ACWLVSPPRAGRLQARNSGQADAARRHGTHAGRDPVDAVFGDYRHPVAVDKSEPEDPAAEVHGSCLDLGPREAFARFAVSRDAAVLAGRCRPYLYDRAGPR